jgi:hypothetical protein
MIKFKTSLKLENLLAIPILVMKEQKDLLKVFHNW